MSDYWTICHQNLILYSVFERAKVCNSFHLLVCMHVYLKRRCHSEAIFPHQLSWNQLTASAWQHSAGTLIAGGKLPSFVHKVERTSLVADPPGRMVIAEEWQGRVKRY